MGEFSGPIYDLFNGLYGQNLSDFLWGFNCETGDYSGANQYTSILGINLFSTFFLMLLFYYILNHPRFKQAWAWLIVALSATIINLMVGFIWTKTALDAGKIGECLLLDADGNQTIFNNHCWGFGLANAIIAFVLFVIFSFAFRWKSSTCKHSPF